MQPELERVEIEPVRRGDHDLPVDHAVSRQSLQQRVVQVGEIAVERAEVAALDEEVGRAAKDDGAESVPFRLEENGAPRRAACRPAWRASARSAARSGRGCRGVECSCEGSGRTPEPQRIAEESMERTQADELMVVSHIYEQSARLGSYEIAAATMTEPSVLRGGEAPVGRRGVPRRTHEARRTGHRLRSFQRVSSLSPELRGVDLGHDLLLQPLEVVLLTIMNAQR